MEQLCEDAAKFYADVTLLQPGTSSATRWSILCGWRWRVRDPNRRVGQLNRSGIVVFVRDAFRDKIVHIADSPIDGRSWHIVHCNFGPVLLCVWYRPPVRGETESIRGFAAEFDLYVQDSVAVLALGDFNVHNGEWLRFSDGTSLEGRELEHVCNEPGLKQQVRSPTRGRHFAGLCVFKLRLWRSVPYHFRNL